MATPAVANARILIVDHVPPSMPYLAGVLAAEGFSHVERISNPLDVSHACRAFQPDLIVLDLQPQQANGYNVLAQVQEYRSLDSSLPVLAVTPADSAAAKRRALVGGATDVLDMPFDGLELLLRIQHLLHARSLEKELQSQVTALNRRIRDRTRDLEEAQLEVVLRLARAAEFRDDSTGQHTQRVGRIAAALAGQLQLPPATVELIRRSAPLHDVGKIGIPDHILLKRGPLSTEETEAMRRHCEMGALILAGSRLPLLQMAEEIALTHHERWDGFGYPRGLRGEEIPISGRIVAIADVFDALTHQRPYKDAWTVSAALEYVESERGGHFDPEIALALLELPVDAEAARL